jgi:hypothetical protein
MPGASVDTSPYTSIRGRKGRCVGMTSALMAALVLSSGCDAQSSSETAWVEEIPVEGLPEGRTYAVRVTLFRYGPEVGGYAEFFGVDGACNTATEPYFCSDHCAYFGPGAFRNGSFRIQTRAPDGAPFLAQATLDGRRSLDLVVTSDGDALGAATLPVRLAFEQDPLGVVSRQCPILEREDLSALQ